MRVLGVCLIVIFLLAVAVSATDIDPNIIKELDEKGEARVIIKLKDSPVKAKGLRSMAVKEPMKLRRQNIRQKQEKVLNGLSSRDFKLKHRFENINALTGKVTREGINQLKNSNVEAVYLDHPVSINMNVSLPLINGDDAHNIQVNGINITGEGQTICLIDTGIDYTHSSLSNCNPITYNFTGTPENLSTPVESAHDYSNNEDTTFMINKTGFSYISAHFVNISLESQGDWDTTDRVIVYDQYNHTIAIYKGDMTDVWTPYAEGDTLYVQIVSDGSIVDYGFYIDQISNGTTNTTMNWSSCPNIDDGWDAYNGDNDPRDDNGHGTHVAGTLISNHSTYKGVAPDANLVVIKALDSSGSGYLSDTDFGIDWCTSKKDLYNISVISLSVGTSTSYSSACDGIFTTTAEAINNAVAANISVVIASGNGNVANGIAAPACIANAVSVGNTDDTDSTSNFYSDDILDLLAPGVNIVSTQNGGGFVPMSGTSMSTPHASAAFALLTQYWKLAYNLDITPAERLTKFKLTGKPILDSRNSLYFPRINVLAAMQPFVNYTASSIANATATTQTSILINISSDVPLSSAILEWTYPNSTLENFSMTQNNNINFQYIITIADEGNHTYKVYANDSTNLIGVSSERLFTKGVILITINEPITNSIKNLAFNMNIFLSNDNITNSSYNITNEAGVIVQSNSNLSINAANFTWTDSINISNSTFTDGNYTINAEASDTTSGSNQGSVIFIVDKTSPLLTAANITPSTIYRNTTIVFTINVTDLYPNTSTVYFESNFSGNVTNYTMNLETGDKYNYTLTGVSNLTAHANISYRFYAIDIIGNSNSTEIYSFVVQNTPPENVSITASANTPEVGNSTTFTVSAYDLDGDSFTYIWNFGDEDTSTSQNPSHTYETTGIYNVTLNVSDGTAQTSASLSVTVQDTKPPVLEDISYDSYVHLQQDVNQTVEVIVFDYSGISNVTLTTTVTDYSTCTKNATHWVCSFTWGGLSVGSYQFYLNFTDNLTSADGTANYSFSVQSCSDNSQNGDETETDCGGSCSACSTSDSNSNSGGGGGGGSSSGGGGSSSSETPSPAKKAAAAPPPVSTQASETTDPALVQEISPPKPKSGVLAMELARYSHSLNLVKGEFVKIDMDYADVPIRELKIKGRENKMIDIEVIPYRDAPRDVSPIENPLRYFEINPSVDSEEISEAEIIFSVPRAWLENNNYLEETVALHIFEEGEWEKIKTKKPKKDVLTGMAVEDNLNVYYEAEIPHFSFFVVTASSETPEKWYQNIIPENFTAQEYFLVGMLAFIIVLLVVYLVVKDKDE